jgi:hypothetical protein
VKTKTEMKKVTKPNQVIHPKFANVRMEEQRVVRIVETSAKTTVHVAWSDNALKAVAVVTIPAADIRTCAMIIMIPTISRPVGPQRWPIMSASATQRVGSEYPLSQTVLAYYDTLGVGGGNRPERRQCLDMTCSASSLCGLQSQRLPAYRCSVK